jgi:hypothetical protein
MSKEQDALSDGFSFDNDTEEGKASSLKFDDCGSLVFDNEVNLNRSARCRC